MWLLGFEGFSSNDEKRERKSDFDNSEEDRKTRIGSLKKKAIKASSKFRRSLKKSKKNNGGSGGVGGGVSAAIEDVRDVEELRLVDAFKQALISEDLLPPRHDDYHMLLRFFFFPCSLVVLIVVLIKYLACFLCFLLF
jgi:hypothetical protein